MITHHLAAGMCRRASARIRELAEAATPGPWNATCYDGMWLVGHPLGLVHTQEHDGLCGFPENDQPDAEHIAAWSPPPAAAVADFLNEAADQIDALSVSDPDAALPPLLSLAARMAAAFNQAQPARRDTREDIEARLAELRAQRDVAVKDGTS